MAKQIVFVSPPGQTLKFDLSAGTVTSAEAAGEPHNHVIVEAGETGRTAKFGGPLSDAGGDPPPPPPDWGMTLRGGLPDDLTATQLSRCETVSHMSFGELSARLADMTGAARTYIVMRG